MNYKYSKSQIMQAISVSKNWKEVAAFFGVKSSATFVRLSNIYQIDSGFTKRAPLSKEYILTLKDAVAQSKTWYEVAIKLNVPYGSQLKKRCEKYNIDYSHFTYNENRRGPARGAVTELLIISDKELNSSFLKKKLWEEKLLPEFCQNEDCGISEWMNKPAPLQLDHINGNNKDNRLENLRILCANCHCQTPTHSRPKKAK